MIILIPLPLFFSSTIYGVAGLSGKSKDYSGSDALCIQTDPPVNFCFCFCFIAWVIVGMIWTFCSAFTVVLYPLWESRAAIVQIATGIVKVGVLSAHPSDRPAHLALVFCWCVM